ncbi:unnamed protein product [Orchesella dallaii]|uniref:Uncharacterized protein n=1 Tax=Orchesella dallaii TaxID=48710 RepID=A0ABP1QC48_9HEXA
MRKSSHTFSQFFPTQLSLFSNLKQSKHFPKTRFSEVFATSARIGYSGVAFVVLSVALIGVAGYNDEKGIFKWTPRWFTNNFRYSAPSSYYISPNRIGTPYKRLSESAHPSDGMYKWSPLFFSGGSSLLGNGGPYQPTSWYGGGSGMYSSNSGPRWSPISSYSGSGTRGNRLLTRYYEENSLPTVPKSMLDLGSNDLSGLLGEEMNGGLGLENDAVDILDGNSGTASQQQQKRK